MSLGESGFPASNSFLYFFLLDIISDSFLAYNARLRGWQRINTKLKHNNRNHRGSMGLDTPRVDSPS
ncbi:hypothetical protein CGU00_19085 [Vibrio metoecus]|nr:hypothetical protein CGU00_19085 [Vibrio metoecus]PAR59492.1 hypothetical protein CGT90_19785 [Vibrio metoecus]